MLVAWQRNTQSLEIVAVAPREVRRSATFLAHAMEEFPPVGSVDGGPSWEMFEAGPLKAIEFAFGHSWEKNVVTPEGVRIVTTHALPFFPAMSIYALLVSDGSQEWVEYSTSWWIVTTSISLKTTPPDK